MRPTRFAIRDTHLFGLVPSRRLDLSLGVDVVPLKLFTQDCVYCQIGRTTHKTIERKDYVPVEAIILLTDMVAENRDLALGVRNRYAKHWVGYLGAGRRLKR